ncbi:MAG: prolyl oligopeptidase family serine peptidase [Bacteroidales bacterium]|nr:prolyl oligopeptidase family serine peptidase [Bacteroidales bacterium]
MKKFIIGLAAALTVMSCTDSNDNKGYIGAPDISVGDGTLTPEIMLSLGRVSDPRLSPDKTLVLYGVTYTSLEKNSSCRNLFVCSVDGSGRKQLTKSGKSISCARWGKNGDEIFFIREAQIWKAPFKAGKMGRPVRISDVPAGISEFKLSPDNSQLIYVSCVPGPVSAPSDRYEDLDKARAYVTEDLMYRHWDHWVTETPRSYVATLCNGVITPDKSLDILAGEPGFELPTEPFGGVEQLDWAPDGRHIAYSCRKKTGLEYAFSTNSCIYVYDILTGQTVALTTEGGYDTDPAWSPDGRHLAWLSMERDGYEADRMRLMLADVEALPQDGEGQDFGLVFGPARELSEGFAYDVESMNWATDSQSIYFASTVDAVSRIHRAGISAEGGIECLTPWQEPGLGAPFGILAGEKSDILLTCAQDMTFPTEIASVEVGHGSGTAPESSLRILSCENSGILDGIRKIRIDKEMIDCANGEQMLCWVLYPSDFDPSGKYGVIEMFNGGPQTALDRSWSFRWNFALMCQQGYVVILPNRHGNSGLGQEWKEQISGDYQGLNMQDYIAAGKWAKSRPWCGKLAGVGASYGGFSVYNMMGIHDGLFDCFIAHAGIFNEKQLWYTTEEAWFGNWDNGGLTEYRYEAGKTGPQGDGITFGGMQQAGAPYARNEKSALHYGNDPESRVTKWNTPLLCIHGMMDFRIPYEQGMAAFNAARMMGVPARLVIFPEENHWVLKPQNALFWQREFFGWLDRWMK